MRGFSDAGRALKAGRSADAGENDPFQRADVTLYGPLC